jgi:hypothetical protein
MSYSIKKLIKQAGVSSVEIDKKPKDQNNIWAEIEANAVNTIANRLTITVYTIKLYASKEKSVLHAQTVKNIIAQAEKTPTFSFTASDAETDDTYIIQNIIIAQSGRINKE